MGDIEYGVMPGPDKHVVWDSYMDNPDISGSGYCIRFTAENHVVADVDGNRYKTVQIGNPVWMAENLKVTHYRNGDAIPEETNNPDWEYLTTGAYCSYNNENDNETYGYLYNWYAVNDSRKIAPAGWHVPTIEEWFILSTIL